ncbi:zinc finger protein SHOOT GRAVITROPISM 5-like [Dendrobium catenatum]|uniref:zinc finger protein SHOOT GRAVITROPISM 5-like n=1 Tax=Dendrobium catenatum TaxID=906689 RepID=UPI0009F69BE2|nr:zinc finger protein SHOOT GRAVITROPISM 5-like [Dendrobium catenatum]
MEESEKRELQLLFNVAISNDDPANACKPFLMTKDQTEQPQLDLNLSMSIITPQMSASNEADSNLQNVQVLKQHAAEQVRLAALERVYAERMRELARRELEQAEKEFARAKMIWERAREEVEKVESMKMIATRRISSACVEITCQNCRNHFQS